MLDETTFTFLLTTLTLVGHVGIVLIVLASALSSALQKRLIKHVVHHGLTYVMLIALASMLGSLYYSDVLGLVPCALCWYQRIFMYPLVFIVGIALFQKKAQALAVVPYALALSLIGFLVALYHTYLQFQPAAVPVTCLLGSSVPCNESYFTAYGYITIPVISLTAFGIILICLWLIKKHG